MSHNQRRDSSKLDSTNPRGLCQSISQLEAKDLCQCHSCRDARSRGIGLPANLAKILEADLPDEQFSQDQKRVFSKPADLSDVVIRIREEWRQHSKEAQLAVWDVLGTPPDQIRKADDDMLEEISRLAIIGFTFLSATTPANERRRPKKPNGN